MLCERDYCRGQPSPAIWLSNVAWLVEHYPMAQERTLTMLDRAQQWCCYTFFYLYSHSDVCVHGLFKVLFPTFSEVITQLCDVNYYCTVDKPVMYTFDNWQFWLGVTCVQYVFCVKHWGINIQKRWLFVQDGTFRHFALYILIFLRFSI